MANVSYNYQDKKYYYYAGSFISHCWLAYVCLLIHQPLITISLEHEDLGDWKFMQYNECVGMNWVQQYFFTDGLVWSCICSFCLWWRWFYWMCSLHSSITATRKSIKKLTCQWHWTEQSFCLDWKDLFGYWVWSFWSGACVGRSYCFQWEDCTIAVVSLFHNFYTISQK